MNLANVISRGARYFPQKQALVFKDQVFTYEELNYGVQRVAARLREAGVEEGDRVALYAANRPEWIMAYYAIIKIGATAVCVSAAYKSMDLGHLLADCNPKIVITSEALLPQVAGCQKSPPPERVLVMERDEVLSSLCNVDRGSVSSLSVPTVDCPSDQTCVILYTGGTTGIPKGAMLSHKNILYTSQNVCYHERMVASDVGICFMPLNHVFGGCHIMNSIYYGCGSLVLLPSFDMDEVIAAIDKYKVTRFYSVPTIYIRFLANPDYHKYLRSVGYFFSAATSMPSDIIEQWKYHFHLPIHESYGMTETSSLVTFNHMYHHKVGSVGPPAGVVEVKVVDPEGKELPPGERGEIIIRGPNVMKGYFNKPQETALALAGGWLHSGDIGLFDEDGYLYVVDRLKHLIITGGYNVFPTEVEEVLYGHRAVEECSVVGIPDKEYGEMVTAFIKLKKDITATPEELVRFCKDRVASYKAPKKIIFVDDFPKSPQGKILKRLLKEQVDKPE